MTPSEKKDPKSNLRESMRSKMQSQSPGPDASPGESSTPAPPQPSGDSGLPGGLKKPIFSGRPGIAEMAAFSRQLATLIEVGIPLVQALKTLAQRIEHPMLKETVGKVAADVESGNSFSESLSKHPSVFSSLIVNVVRVGETGGILEQSLNYLAEIMERRQEIQRRVKGALAYPVVVLSVCFLAITLILAFAMPVFRETYATSSVELPGLTKFVLGLSSFFESWWWLIILVVVVGVFLLRRALAGSESLKRKYDALLFKLPLVRDLVVKVNVTRSSRTMANLLKAGIPLLEAMRISAETAENILVREMLYNVRDHVEKGGQIEDPFRKADLFPALVVDMIAIGNESNRLDLMFDKIASTYDSDVDNSIRTMNAVLEPALIVVLGLIVLVMALAVLMPYWDLATGLDVTG